MEKEVISSLSDQCLMPPENLKLALSYFVSSSPGLDLGIVIF